MQKSLPKNSCFKTQGALKLIRCQILMGVNKILFKEAWFILPMRDDTYFSL